MKNLLEQKLFSYVIKPGRYSGGEPGTIVKSAENRISYLHCYPDKYEVGQAYPGLQSLYHIVNSDDRFLCERAFAVDNDAEEIIRREKIDLFSLESKRPANQFDAIGFTLPFELVYTNVLAMLELAKIPLQSKERNNSHPIIMAGGPAAFNPEPMADFIDLFFIGDAEEGLPEILEILYNSKDKSRDEQLEAIVKNVESVYVPEFYDENYQPKYDFVPAEIKGRVVTELKSSYFPAQPIVPLIETAHKHLAVEIMRGCPQGCRFCMAGSIYRPVRPRSKDEILQQLDQQWKNSGYEEISLLSLSSSDYPDIEELAVAAANKIEKYRVSITLPSLRPGTLSSRLLNAIKKVRAGGLTISPEAGSERMRLFIRKDFPDEAVYDTARLAFEKGWTTLKLYFMLGLPTENYEDLDAIYQMVDKISDISHEFKGRRTVNVTLSPFVPKPHTPFQWDEILPFDEVLKRITYIKRNTRGRNVNYKYPTVEASLLQGLLGRGDRSLGGVILHAYQNGSRFDSWSEGFDYNIWQAAFENSNQSIEELMRSIPFSKELPWQMIRKGVSAEHLQKERQRTSQQIRDYIPKVRDNEEESDNNLMSFGRSKKKLASKSVIAPTKNRVRFRLSKSERYKYMGHLDNLRLIERSLRISNIPVAYSQGYNPSMKLSYGPPLSLGMTSQAEYFDVTLDSGYMPYMGEALKQALPEGMEIMEARVVMNTKKSLTSKLNRVEYSLPLESLQNPDEIDKQINEFMCRSEIIVQRQGKDKVTEIDIRKAVYNLYVENNQLILLLGIAEGGYAKVNEVLRELLLDDYNDSLDFAVCRKQFYAVDSEENQVLPMDI